MDANKHPRKRYMFVVHRKRWLVQNAASWAEESASRLARFGRYAIKQFDGNEFRQQVLDEFSGVICIDEVHLGKRVLLLASDPLADNPLACALVSKNDADHMRRFMQNLKSQGPKQIKKGRGRPSRRPQAQGETCTGREAVSPLTCIRAKAIEDDGQAKEAARAIDFAFPPRW